MSDSQNFLRNSLRGNGVFSTLSGLLFLFAAAPVSAAIGLPDPRILMAVGVCLLGFAGLLAFLSSRAQLDTSLAMQIVWADLAWVVGTIPIVVFALLNRTGTIAAIAIADVVLTFAVLQYLGIRRIRGSEAARALGVAG